MKNKPRIRTVKIKRIYETPKLLKEGKNYNFYSFGIKLDDDSYVNITTSAKDEEEAIEKTKSKFICDEETKEKIQEEKEYVCYEESTDEEEKYWRVTGFVKPDNDVSYKDKTVAELKQNKQVDNAIGGSGGETPKSTYGDIMAQKDRRIVRQTCLKAAANFLSNKDSNSTELIEITEKLEEWVYRK